MIRDIVEKMVWIWETILLIYQATWFWFLRSVFSVWLVLVRHACLFVALLRVTVKTCKYVQWVNRTDIYARPNVFVSSYTSALWWLCSKTTSWQNGTGKHIFIDTHNRDYWLFFIKLYDQKYIFKSLPFVVNYPIFQQMQIKYV